MQEVKMPELPEVETVVRELREKILGKELESVEELRTGTVCDSRNDERELGTIEAVKRRGKYIIIESDSGYVILVHLRMTGKLIFSEHDDEVSSHCRAELRFRDGSILYFDDIRTFGTIDILPQKELMLEKKLGIEPLSNDFNAEYLLAKFKNRKAPVKNLLLNQKVVAGLGNIYVCEILYRSGVSPVRRGDSITEKEAEQIVADTKQVLREAIDSNGTTISDYRRVDDKQGEFQNFLRVYGKKQCSCGAEIIRIKQGGRSTYYCGSCQR